MNAIPTNLNLFNSSLAEVTISYSHKVLPSHMQRVTSSKDVYEFVSPNWPDLDYRESFAVLLINRANKVLGINWISRGGISGTVADPKLIFQAGLKANASSLILIHNHPSGNNKPSEADIRLTKKMKDAGVLLDMPVLDHIIFTSESYFSFADEGMI